ncbi:MAG TPA: endolytic transglycosylase MltG [Solirubrobacterales bacterium]|nr:endolytic transglycosylase MltG [Solirubrobacterales bacterium]
MSEDWRSDDAFADPDDPAAREREERRLAREEKRQKKAAKQAEKEAAKAPPPEPEKPAEPPKPPRTPEQEFWDEDPPTPEPEAAPKAGDDAAPPPAPPSPAAEEPTTGDQKAAAASAAAAAGAAAATSEPATPPEVTPEPPREQTWEHEYEPRQAPAEDWGFHEEGDPAMTGAASGGRRAGSERGGIFGRFARHPALIAVVIVAVLVIWFLWALFQPFHGDGSGKVAVTIPKGSSVSEVGELLEKEGVIGGSTLFGLVDTSTLFQMRVTLAGKRSDLYAGHFTLKHDMSYGAAIDALSQPPAKRVTTVTIPEGYSRSQAAQLVEEDGVPGSYTKKTVKSKYLNPAEYGGKNAKNLEGFLFPDTFELKPKAPVADLVQLQLEDFKRKIKKVNMKYAKSKNLTVFDVVTIASMIEREAGVAKQRKLVSSVIYNRLHEGIPLGIDATIRFATGNYTKPLTQSQLETNSPYNTRTNQGLPPGPINSPGLAALQAAAHPAKTEYLFYVNKPNTCDELSFSKTNAEFEKDVAAYEKAREENGGNEPSTCGE